MARYNRLLLRFDHGLGDCAQFTGAVKHLLDIEYASHISVATKESGKQTLYRWLDGWVEHPELYHDSQFDEVRNIRWAECGKAYADAPSTKASLCLEVEFGVKPVSAPPHIVVSEQRAAEIDWIIEKIPKPYMVFHYEGNTAASRKNLPHPMARQILSAASRQGLAVVLLDWDNRSPHIQRNDVIHFDPSHPIWKGIGTGDGESLRYLIDNAKLFVGIDSGPFHVATSSPTKTIGLWRGMHPVHYCDLTPNTEHILLPNHEDNVRGDRTKALDYFYANYNYRISQHFAEEIEIAMVDNNEPNVQISPSDNFFIRRQLAGQDMLIFNDIVRNDSYRAWILGEPHRSGPQVVVDVGAHLGTFSYLWHKINPEAKIFCVEACPENIELLKRNVADFATVRHAACTYEQGKLYLLNTVIPGKSTTGGSLVVTEHELQNSHVTSEYYIDKRPLERVTLEDIAMPIDILKLDCEACEFSLLEHCPNMDKIGLILGEYHGRERWHELRRRKFPDWPYSEGSSGNLGTFHMRNPRWKGCWATQS